MELSAVGESVFAAESIIKRRIRRVFAAFFHPQAVCLRACYATICLCSSDSQPSNNLNMLRICFFAGSLGISREMEGLVSKVSTITEACEGQRSILAARTTAPPQPGVIPPVDVFFRSFPHKKISRM